MTSPYDFAALTKAPSPSATPREPKKKKRGSRGEASAHVTLAFAERRVLHLMPCPR